MPIRPELRKFYGRDWRTVTRPRILARAGNRCEQCGVPNHAEVTRRGGCWLQQTVSWLNGVLEQWRRHDDSEIPELDFVPNSGRRKVRIVLTVAHLNHIAGDDRDENLKALCQWCHLTKDQGQHHLTRAARKDAARPLLLERSTSLADAV